MRIPPWIYHLQERFLTFLPVIYIVYALPVTVALALVSPPFEAPDEPCHFLRMVQISEGHLFASRSPDPLATINNTSGGYIPTCVIKVALTPYCGPKDTVFDPTSGRQNHIFDYPWASETNFIGFPNTAVYPFTCYLPGAIGVAVGRMAGLSVLECFFTARLINAFISVILSALAIHLVSRGKVIFACLLSLPMGLFLFSSVSQDAMLIAYTALAVGLMNRYLDGPATHRTGWVLGLALFFLTLCVTGRPVYLPFLCVAAIGVYFVSKSFKKTLMGCGLAFVTVVIYMQSVKHLGYFVRQNVNPARQAAFLLHHPLQMIHLMLATTEAYYNNLECNFIGWFGWLSYGLPQPFYPLVGWMLVIALFSDLKLKDTVLPLWSRLAATVLSLSVIILIYIAFFIVWNNEKNIYIDGEQGRYYIPIAFMLTLALGNRDFSWMKISTFQALRFGANLAPLVVLIIADFATCLACLCHYYY
jgi:uncharacterized membrane protein